MERGDSETLYDSREELEKSRKGKERATDVSPAPRETIFKVDDDSDDEGHRLR